MRRREFIAGLGGVAAWPVLAHGQQSALPVIGFLNSGSPEAFASFVAAFTAGLKEAGFVEGQNVTIKYAWARNQYDRLPVLASELVQNRVAVIVATGSPLTAQVAKDATKSVPIVFTTGYDPVAAGLVESLSHPGGNLTGASFFTSTLVPKRIELLHELLPDAKTVALLTGPEHGLEGAETLTGAQNAARALGIELRLFDVARPDDLGRVFATVADEHVEAVVLSSEPFWIGQAAHAAALAVHYGLPAIGNAAPAPGLLMSYSTSIAEGYRNAGVYAGKILSGAHPADLPIMQPAKFRLVINVKTAKALGLAVPPSLLARADEVIE
jgi:putative tryptophan/tyrosine transport system substrate-binding protein